MFQGTNHFVMMKFSANDLVSMLNALCDMYSCAAYHVFVYDTCSSRKQKKSESEPWHAKNTKMR